MRKSYIGVSAMNFTQHDVITMHYREVVMGRWEFEYVAIQSKIPLSLSNF